MTKDWIVISGTPLSSTDGGGFEFFGPFTEKQAMAFREAMILHLNHIAHDQTHVVTAVQLLSGEGYDVQA